MLPNLLTILRIIAAPLIVIILLSDQKHMIVIGLIIFILASITDFLDGYLARLFNQSSMMGKILDPIADKLLITCALISLLSNGIVKDFHIVAATLLIIRELFVSGLREYVQDKSLSVTTIAKIKTSAQMIAIILLIPSDILDERILFIGLTLLWLSTVLSLFSAYQYLIIAISKKR